MQTFGQKLKELRLERNLTQPELAKLMGVSNGMISFWENDKYEPTANNIVKAAKIFNVTTDYLLGNEN